MTGKSEEWNPDVNFPEDVAKVPAGCNVVDGKEIYVDGNGDEYSREDYIKVHGVDPKELWEAIQEYRKKGKPTVRIGKS